MVENKSDSKLEMIIWGKDLAEVGFNRVINKFIPVINRCLPKELDKPKVKVTYVCGPKLVEFNYLEHTFQEDYPLAKIQKGDRKNVMGKYGNPILNSICRDPEMVRLYILPAKTPIRNMVIKLGEKNTIYEGLIEKKFNLDNSVLRFQNKKITLQTNESMYRPLTHPMGLILNSILKNIGIIIESKNMGFAKEMFNDFLPNISHIEGGIKITKEMIESGEYKEHMINYMDRERLICGQSTRSGSIAHRNSYGESLKNCIDKNGFAPMYLENGLPRLVHNRGEMEEIIANFKNKLMMP